MAKITLTEQEEYPTLPDDSIIHVKVLETSTETIQGKNGKSDWTKLSIKFKILGVQVTGDGSPVDDYDNLIGQWIYGSLPFRLTNHPENKLRQWCEAILGVDLGVGFELDTDVLVSRECRAITSSYEKKNGGFRKHQVESLLVMPRGGAGYGAPATTQFTQPLVAQPAQQFVAQPAQQQFVAQPAAQAAQQSVWGGAGAWDTDKPPF